MPCFLVGMGLISPHSYSFPFPKYKYHSFTLSFISSHSFPPSFVCFHSFPCLDINKFDLFFTSFHFFLLYSIHSHCCIQQIISSPSFHFIQFLSISHRPYTYENNMTRKDQTKILTNAENNRMMNKIS